jgi:SAM-dependent methyltransferase
LLGKNPFRWLARTWREKGVVRVLKIAWHAALDSAWDLRHGTETLARIAPHELQTNSKNKKWATYYGATRARPLLELLERLQLPLTSGFVDFGSGKGRVLLIAAQYGFKRIVGIDFSPQLCEVARRNVEAFQRRNGGDSEFTVVHSDVVHYDIRAGQSVFFLYDPFSTEVLAEVLTNLRRSLAECPREICLIYNAPRHHALMQRSGLFDRFQQYEIGGNEFHVYWSTPSLG